MTTMERFANNMLTIVIARAAMMVTPVLLSFMAWLGWQVWTSLESRVAAVESQVRAQASMLQDHESRMVFGKAQREALADATKEQFGDIAMVLKDLTQQMGVLNGSMIRVQTTIENRLPPRTGALDTSQ